MAYIYRRHFTDLIHRIVPVYYEVRGTRPTSKKILLTLFGQLDVIADDSLLTRVVAFGVLFIPIQISSFVFALMHTLLADLFGAERQHREA